VHGARSHWPLCNRWPAEHSLITSRAGTPRLRQTWSRSGAQNSRPGLHRLITPGNGFLAVIKCTKPNILPGNNISAHLSSNAGPGQVRGKHQARTVHHAEAAARRRPGRWGWPADALWRSSGSDTTPGHAGMPVIDGDCTVQTEGSSKSMPRLTPRTDDPRGSGSRSRNFRRHYRCGVLLPRTAKRCCALLQPVLDQPTQAGNQPRSAADRPPCSASARHSQRRKESAHAMEADLMPFSSGGGWTLRT